MSQRDPHNVPPEDLPWNDVPADSDVVPGSEEPEPAEVEGDEGEEVDVSERPLVDQADEYRRDTLDERLAEEEPDRLYEDEDADAGEIQAPEGGQDDIALQAGEPDDEWTVDDDEAAEDAAMHLRPEDRV